MPYMTRLPADLAAFGLKVEVVPGWETRGSSAFAPGGVVCHWTAGPAGLSIRRASLAICTNGRPGLPGPLCNVYLGRDGVCVVVAAGRANHAGTGSWRGLVGNSAVYGIEAESAGPNDWTDAQRAAYPRLVAALLRGLGRGAEWAAGHSEWAGPRKVDINGYTMTGMRAGVAALLAGQNPTPTQEDDDMAQSDIDEMQRKLSLLLNVETSKRDPREQTPREQVLDNMVTRPEVGGEISIRNAIVEGSVNSAQGRAFLGVMLAQLLAAPAADTDADAIAAAVRALGDDLAADVASRLRVTAA